MGYSPLTLSKALRRPIGTALVVLSVLVLVYSVIIMRILSGVLFVVLIALGYLAYRLIAALDALADGHQRLADAREHEAFSRSDRPTDDTNNADASSGANPDPDGGSSGMEPGT